MRHQFSIDRGGTFTDCLLLDRESGTTRIAKVLSGPDSPILGIRQLLDLAPEDPIPPSDVRLGTTLATNALLERKGANVGLLISSGFRDLLEIGTQARRDLFSLRIEGPAKLYECVEEVGARMDASRRVLQRPERAEVDRVLQSFLEAGITSVAIVVVHSYADDSLERELGEWARAFPFDSVVTSTEAAAELGLLARAQTTVLDAYLLPVLSRYATQLRRELPGSRIRMMQSSGGLATPERLRGPASLLSGPADGAVAAARLTEILGTSQVLTFDMGGTSTDVALVGREPHRRFESEVSGIQVLAPMVDIHTVAAGGGSICRFDGETLTVGPDSAGASPGPLIYGSTHATELTISDVNLLLGRLAGDYFPFPLAPARARAAIEAIQEALRVAGHRKTEDEILLGFSEIAATHMAEAITKVALRRGEDPRSATLLAFGGAGGQHACDVARKLGVRQIAIHRLGGVFSAYGIGMADTLSRAERDAGRLPLCAESLARLEPVRATLGADARHGLGDEAGHPGMTIHHAAQLRYAGTQSSLLVPWGTSAEMREHFESDHRQRFSFVKPEATIEIVTLHAEARIVGTLTHPRSVSDSASPPRSTESLLSVDYDGSRKRVPLLRMNDFEEDTPLSGPALILDPTGTVFVAGDFEAVLRGEILFISRKPDSQLSAPSSEMVRTSGSDPILLEVLGARLSAIAEQMGEALRQSAMSTNIRDRLDFSCAVFDGQGTLIANAPHIPVHLGAMGESVRGILRRHPRMQPGDAYVTNDPQLGGSHLPDITVVSPVFSDGYAETPSYFVASRGHHADVGGKTPGSMPADSTSLLEEGVVLSALPLVSGGRFLEEDLRRRLVEGPRPARNPEENLADLRAQVAAGALGVRLLSELERQYSRDLILVYMGFLVDLAERKTRRAIARLRATSQSFEDRMDDGAMVHVTLHPSPDDGTLAVDFSPSADQSSGNSNSPRAVTIAAVLYFLRTLIGEDLPLNDGCLRPVRIVTRYPSLLDPATGAAVAAGNVETSMRICDVLFAASGLAAASQGTMNNLSFGNESFGYYETIGGGAGGGPGFAGGSCVQTHMTNTRITDVEALEARFPVLVREFSKRRGSGGVGAYRGGDGIIREFEFTQDVQVTLLTGRRDSGPFGLCGGDSGRAGRNLVDGKPVPARFSGLLRAGQTLRIETPGGGGYGAAGSGGPPGERAPSSPRGPSPPE